MIYPWLTTIDVFKFSRMFIFKYSQDEEEEKNAAQEYTIRI